MQRYEYKVVPAPAKGVKAKGVKTPEGRFSQGLQEVLNAVAADGWEYCRAELLPSEERSGLTGSVTNWRNVLVFRRAVAVMAERSAPAVRVDAPEPEVAATQPEPEQPEKQRKAESLITVSGLFAAQNSPDEAAGDKAETAMLQDGQSEKP